jgi:sugar O-acyltransferase (sialic acid O-acetyltransferase NeuD family)
VVDARCIVLFGGGGHARATADVVRRLGMVVDAVVAPEIEGFDGTDKLSDDDAGAARAACAGGAVVGIGDNALRLRIVERLRDAGVPMPAIVASTATVAPDARLGPGTVVFEHAHVGARAIAGDACVVNTSAIVEHDAVLGDAVFVSPGAVLLGGASCGASSRVGAGAVVLPCRTLGESAVVGAGAVVRDAVEARQLVVGIPARRLNAELDPNGREP